MGSVGSELLLLQVPLFFLFRMECENASSMSFAMARESF